MIPPITMKRPLWCKNSRAFSERDEQKPRLSKDGDRGAAGEDVGGRASGGVPQGPVFGHPK